MFYIFNIFTEFLFLGNSFATGSQFANQQYTIYTYTQGDVQKVLTLKLFFRKQMTSLFYTFRTRLWMQQKYKRAETFWTSIVSAAAMVSLLVIATFWWKSIEVQKRSFRIEISKAKST